MYFSLKVKVFCNLFALVFLFKAYGQNTNSIPLTLDKLIASYHEKGLFNGSILISANDTVLLKKAYGYSNISWKNKNEIDTKMMLASLSKHFTANLILQLYQEKKIALNDSVHQHLIEFKNSPIGNLTIRQLLSHTSGIKRDIFELAEETQVFQPRREIYKALIDSKLLFIPGSASSYSNTGYYLLSEIIEKVTNLSYNDALCKLIFDPLEMNNSGFKNNSLVIPKLARGYEILLGEAIYGNIGHTSSGKGASGIYSTVEDIYKYELALQEYKLLSKETQQLMSTPIKKGWGYGWKSRVVGKDSGGNNVHLTFHNGDAGGFASQYLRYAPDHLTIIMLSNQDVLPRSELFNQITTIINGKQPKPIRFKTGDELYKTALKEGTEEAYKKAVKHKQNGGRWPNPIRINFCGNQLLKVERIKDAKIIHSLNMKLYPKHWLGYVALGLILKDEGKIEEAKDLYLKVLDFDPKNSYAKRFLSEL